jgi:lipopolysaccharide/colanic/teichoic acid biosynthesis glycosyltransferase
MKKGLGSIYNRFFKRIIDIFCAAFALIAFCWLYAIVALLVRLKMGSPVIFCQERPGKIDPKTGKERMFKLYKFRSMTNERDADGNLLPAAQRLTRFGRILRATSLDELPETWNILKGDMSVVGPRPVWANYLDYYNDYERQRHLVRPGLTGLAQVNGRNTVTWKRKFEMDVAYVHSISLITDIKIVFLTVKKVFMHEGVEFADNHQSIMDYFSNRDR